MSNPPRLAWPIALAAAALSLATTRVGVRAETLENLEQTRVFNMCASPSALPYTSEDPATPGFQLDLQRAIVDLMGWEASITWVHDRASSERLRCGGFLSRRLDVQGRPLTPLGQPEGVPYRISRAYMGTGIVVVLPPGHRTDFASLDELARADTLQGGKPVGVTLGMPGEERVRAAGLHTATFLYQEQVIEALVAGRVAAGLVVRENAAWYLKRNPGAFARFDAYRVDAALRWNVAMELRGASPTALGAIGQILGRFSRDGTLERIMARYGIGYQPPFPPE